MIVTHRFLCDVFSFASYVSTMHITSGLSPVSGEMLDASVLQLYGDGVERCTTYFDVDHNAVPESSHTVEIEYVYESPETFATNDNVSQITPEDDPPPGDDEKTKTSNNGKPKRPPTKRTAPRPTAMDDSETDLTNLTWLQNITNIMAVPTFPIPPMSPNPKPVQQQNTRLQKFNETIAKCQRDFTENRDEYRNNANMKPPYSYSTLICMAMRNNNDKLTLSAIYSWIRENFKYYRNADPTWQVSYIFTIGSEGRTLLIQ